MKIKEEAIKFYNKFKIFIFPGIVLVSGAILIIFIILPQLSGFIEGKENIEAEKLKLQKLEVKAEQLNVIDENDLNKKLQVVLTSLPIEKDLTTVIAVIQKLGNQSGVILNAVIFGSGKEDKADRGIANFTVRVEITAPKANFKQFLTNIERAPLLLKAQSIEISSSGRDDILSVGLTIDVFYSPTPTNLGGIESEIPTFSPEEEDLIVNLSQTVTTAPVTLFSSSNPPNIPRGKSNPFE